MSAHRCPSTMHTRDPVLPLQGVWGRALSARRPGP
jgi:hypothetical protein